MQKKFTGFVSKNVMLNNKHIHPIKWVDYFNGVASLKNHTNSYKAEMVPIPILLLSHLEMHLFGEPP